MEAKLKHFTATAAFLITVLMLIGCAEENADTAFQLYLERLGRTLDLGSQTRVPHESVARPPRPGKLRLKIPADTLSTLDFMDLRGCELQVTIGKSNSSLGRLARDSQKLLLALEFLHLAPACIDYLTAAGELELAKKLDQARRQKLELLPSLIFNATLASEEFQAFWRPAPVTKEYPANTSSAVITALEHINQASARWLSGNYRADNQSFELQLSEVSGGDGGQLWRALLHQGQWLDSANAKLEQRGPLCTATRRPQAAEILPNVVRKYFIDGIQPRAAMLGRRYHQLLPPLFALEHQLRTKLPANYLGWSASRNSALKALASKPKQHVSRLQQTLANCRRDS